MISAGGDSQTLRLTKLEMLLVCWPLLVTAWLNAPKLMFERPSDTRAITYVSDPN